MANTLKLEIVTPEGISFSDEVDIAFLPGIDGELGIYPQHVPLVTQIKPGEVTVRKGYEELYLAVGDGFAEITPSRIAILTDMAIRAEEIDEAAAEEARKRAQARLEEKLSGEELAVINASLARSLAQLHVKRRQRH